MRIYKTHITSICRNVKDKHIKLTPKLKVLPFDFQLIPFIKHSRTAALTESSCEEAKHT